MAAGRHRAVPTPIAGGYARHIGRIGALAVTLGVGIAIATGTAAVASADEGSESSSAEGGSTDSAPSQETAPTAPATTNPSTIDGVEAPKSSDAPSAGPDQAGVPAMNVSSSGGALTSILAVEKKEQEAGDAESKDVGTSVDSSTMRVSATSIEVRDVESPGPEAPDPAPAPLLITVLGLAGRDVAAREEGTNGPQAVDDRVKTPMDTPVTIAVLANDYDATAIGSVGKPRYGSVVITKDGVLVYTPRKGFAGEDVFDYDAIDDEGRTARAYVTVEVTKPREQKADKAYTVGKDTTLDVSVATGVAADTDFKGWSAGLHIKTNFGTITMKEDGSFVYTPNPGFVGQDTFMYSFQIKGETRGPFLATIDVLDSKTPAVEANYGVALALNSAFGACAGDWQPWQKGPGTENLTCLYPEAKPERL